METPVDAAKAADDAWNAWAWAQGKADEASERAKTAWDEWRRWADPDGRLHWAWRRAEEEAEAAWQAARILNRVAKELGAAAPPVAMAEMVVDTLPACPFCQSPILTGETFIGDPKRVRTWAHRGCALAAWGSSECAGAEE